MIPAAGTLKTTIKIITIFILKSTHKILHYPLYQAYCYTLLPSYNELPGSSSVVISLASSLPRVMARATAPTQDVI